MTDSSYGIVGTIAPELTMDNWINSDGEILTQPLRLADFSQQVKIIYCFQHWCPGCHSTGFPTLKRITDQYSNLVHDRKLSCLAVQTVFEGYEQNTANKLRETQFRYKLKIPFAQDEQRPTPSMMKDYRTGGTPWFIFINQTNHVIFNNFRIDLEHAAQLIETSINNHESNPENDLTFEAIDDISESRYLVKLTQADYGFVDYRKKDQIVYLDYAYVPENLRGKNYAAAMLEAVLKKIKHQKLKVIPVCGYTQYYLKRNKQWSTLLNQ